MNEIATVSTEKSLDKLFEALAKAQGEMEGAKKGSQNPFFKSRYADLNSCFEACREALSKQGIAVIQLPSFEEGRVVVETILGHSSGQSISNKLSLKILKDDPQSVGSCITYARRYGLVSMVGLSQEDDDGEKLTDRGNGGKPEVSMPSPKPAQPLADPVMDKIKVIASKIFSSPDAFKIWRVDNGLADSLKTATFTQTEEILEKLEEKERDKSA